MDFAFLIIVVQRILEIRSNIIEIMTKMAAIANVAVVLRSPLSDL